MCQKIFEVIHQISRSRRLKNQWFGSNLSKTTRPVAAIKSLRFALLSCWLIKFNEASHCCLCPIVIIHWGQVTHIYVSKVTIISSDNGLSPGQRQAIIWATAGILLIGLLGTNFSEISIKIHAVSIKKNNFNVSSWKWRTFCLCLILLMACYGSAIVVSYIVVNEAGFFVLWRLTCTFLRCYTHTPSNHWNAQ